MGRMTYAKAGVNIRAEGSAIAAIASAVERTFLSRRGKMGESLAGIGHFSALIRITDELALALSCDGVGSKIMVAEALGKYDTIGIDLVAMNANDIICVGAEPLVLLDYLAMERPDPSVAGEIGKGLVKGAGIAGVSIVGGELATLPEMVKGLDLVGMMIGAVDIGDIVTGGDVSVGDVVVGLESNGIHSNGLTLARKVLLGEYDINDEVFDDRSVGEELLRPTRIYVKEVLSLMGEIRVKGMANITGGGLENLLRLGSHGYVIDFLPEPHAIFQEIQRLGDVSDAEMYRTFNMGVGFAVVVSKEDVDEAIDVLGKMGTNAWALGRVTKQNGVRVKARVRFLLK
jgi:phosphoribosylformylglycinamidine cyclo-ligase